MRQSELESVVKLRESGDLEEARSLLSHVLEESPNDAEANYQMAWLCDLRGREREAIPHYVRAIAGSLPNDEKSSALLGLGSSHRARGEYSQAAEVLRRGVREFPEDRAMRTFLALALYNAGENREAVELLLKNLVETTSDPNIKAYKEALTFYADRLDEVWD